MKQENKNKLVAGYRRVSKLTVALCAAVIAAVVSGFSELHAQEAVNEGLEKIVTAINGLKPDIGDVVVASLGIGIVVLGAMIAWRVAKKFFA